MDTSPTLSEDRILHLWDIHVGQPTAKLPLADSDLLVFARAVLAAAEHYVIAAFLERTGQYVTNDASREAAIADAIAADRAQRPVQAGSGEAVAWVDVKDRHEGPYEFHGKELLDSGRHYLYAAPQPAVPQGWRMVPEEPTLEMEGAVLKAFNIRRDLSGKSWGGLTDREVYKAMLAAAPDHQEPRVCTWTETEEAWSTGCGNLHTIIADGPKENGMRWCCYCGERLVVPDHQEPKA